MSSLELLLSVTGAILLAPVTLVALLNLLFWPRKTAAAECVVADQVSVLIPARNEDQNLEACVNAALAQGSIIREVLVYNDGSTDRTQSVLDRLVTSHQDLVKQVKTRSLPDGWVGKSHACARLAQQASATWLLFIDADTRLQPGAARNLVAEARRTRATFISAWPKIEMRSVPERLLMPLLNFIVFSLFPAPVASRRRGASLGLAHGACVLTERETYERLGGHKLVRDRLFEDTALARAWRERSENSQVIDGRDIASVRMYEDFGGIWAGFSKNYYPALGSHLNFGLFQLFMLAAFVALPLIAIASVVMSAAASSMILIALASLIPRALISIRFGHPLWSVPFHPFAVLLMVALGVNSWWRSSFGGGVDWKGRNYKASGVVVTDD